VRNESSEIILFIVNLEDITDAPLKHDSYRGSLRHSAPRFTLVAAQRYASSLYLVAVCPSVRLSVRPSQADIVSKRLEESSWFLAWRLL